MILLSDIDGMFTADPNEDPEAEIIPSVTDLKKVLPMASSHSGSSVGTGGMRTKLMAAELVCASGASMVIANGNDVENIRKILDGEEIGTWFHAGKDPSFDLFNYIEG